MSNNYKDFKSKGLIKVLQYLAGLNGVDLSCGERFPTLNSISNLVPVTYCENSSSNPDGDTFWAFPCKPRFKPNPILLNNRIKIKIDNGFLKKLVIKIGNRKKFTAVLNKTIYDLMLILIDGKKLSKDNSFYYPMMEFEDWFMREGLSLNNTLNAFQIFNKSKIKSKTEMVRHNFKLNDKTKPEDWTITHLLDKECFIFECKRESILKQLSYEECGFNRHKKNRIPIKTVGLLESYANFQHQLEHSQIISASKLWEDTVVGKRKRELIRKWERELQKKLQMLLNIDSDIFIKQEEEFDGIKYYYYECKITLKTPAFKIKVETEQGKSFDKKSVHEKIEHDQAEVWHSDQIEKLNQERKEKDSFL